jgi:hypothetical protein
MFEPSVSFALANALASCSFRKGSVVRNFANFPCVSNQTYQVPLDFLGRDSILISSGTDWTNRTKRLAARAPKLDIFADSFVLRDHNGWHITEGGRQFLTSLEAPLPIVAEAAQPPEADMTKQPRSPAQPTLRLVVNNDKQPPDGRQQGPSRRRA